MNRIKEMREAARLSRRELGDRVCVTQHTIRKYEIGEIDVSLTTLAKIAEALECDVQDLVVSGVDATQSDVVPADAPLDLPALGDILGQRGLKLYRVETDVLAEAGIRKSEIVTVDQTEPAIKRIAAGDVLVISVPSPSLLLLRQYLPPSLLTTNRFGPDNSSLKLDDRSLRLSIVGVVIRAGTVRRDQ